MTRKNEKVEAITDNGGGNLHSALELWRHMGGESRRAEEGGKRPPDSMLAVFKDRATYTFILDDDVASIHFDRRRGEIFFKGHNIHNLKLTESQINALKHAKEVFLNDPKAKKLFNDYSATLARLLADNKVRGVVS